MSSEFRSPLNICLVFLQGLLSDIVSEHTRGIIMLIVTQINLLLSLVNDILDLKLIEEGQFEAKMERFNPREAIDFILKMLNGQVALSNTKIQVDYIADEAANESSNHDMVFEPPPSQNRLLSSDSVLPMLVGIQRLSATD